MALRTLRSGFLASADRFADRTALEVEGKEYSYQQLRNAATGIAATLQSRIPNVDFPLTGVLGQRSLTAFAGILGTLFRGHGYVPLNPEFPPQRTAQVINRSGIEALIVGLEAMPSLPEVLKHVGRTLTLFFPDKASKLDGIDLPKGHNYVSRDQFAPGDAWRPTYTSADDTAYLLFTSGSTGQPKGVEVTHSNIRHFIDVMVQRYEITEDDRFSQMFDLVFDLSLFDMFVAWERGACVCCPNKGDAQLPARYINESRITVWFSVPSLAVAMANMRMLTPGLYPHLRLSLFCGEALRTDIASRWAEAAPNSVLENLYGPTEVTLACTLFRWPGSADDVGQAVVPIGHPYPGMEALIVDENLEESPFGREGELLMSGPQVAKGYWKDKERTEAAFIVPKGKSSRYYRTGDLVSRASEDSPINYKGRLDHQVKIRGNRIELGEIECVLRAFPGITEAVAIGWPRTESGVEAIAAIVQSDKIDTAVVQESLNEKLPQYMIPRRIEVIDTMPLNQNGKIDRNALAQILDASSD